MGSVDRSFVGRLPGMNQLHEVAKDFKVFYKKAEGKTPGSYSMDHSAGSYSFDSKGRIRLYTRYGSGAENLVSDIRLLLKKT